MIVGVTAALMSRVTVRLVPHMPMSVRRPCPACATGDGVAHSVTTVPDRPVVTVTLVCDSCGHEWQVERESPPLRPTIDPSETKLAS